jgi:hypothetical protein
VCIGLADADARNRTAHLALHRRSAQVALSTQNLSSFLVQTQTISPEGMQAFLKKNPMDIFFCREINGGR